MTRHTTTHPRASHNLLTFGVYCNFIQSIKHFDTMQTNLRIMTSTALLATFAAIGFICASQNQVLHLNDFYTVILICLVGLSAIITLWHLDLVFYEKLYICAFVELFDLEARHNWLPQAHHNMLFGEAGQDKPANVVYYYIGCGWTLILTIGIALTYLLKEECLAVILIGPLLTFITTLLFAKYLRKQTSSLEKSMKQIYQKKGQNGSIRS